MHKSSLLDVSYETLHYALSHIRSCVPCTPWPPSQVLATVRRELFRTLLLQRIDFFDRHDAAELTSLINTELDSLRALVFKCKPPPPPLPLFFRAQ